MGLGSSRGADKIQVSNAVVLQSLPSEAEDLVDKLPTDQEAAAFPEVVRTKTFVLEPMSLEDALEQVPLTQKCPNPGGSNKIGRQLMILCNKDNLLTRGSVTQIGLVSLCQLCCSCSI